MNKSEIKKRLAEIEEAIDEAKTERDMWEQEMYKLEREQQELEAKESI